MSTWAALATGQSMSQALADSVRGRCKVVVVSDAFRLAPWADAMVSQDAAWWRRNEDALNFAGRRFNGAAEYRDVERFAGIPSETNSGLLALHVAIKLGATKLILLGYDMQGTHYFGPHPAPLKNTTRERFGVFQTQFARFQPRGVDIVNCTVGSALTAYRMGDLAEELP